MKYKIYSILGLVFIIIILRILTLSFSDEENNATQKGIDNIDDGSWLLTVDGYGVTEEEYLMFLSEQKAVTANYFWTKYNVQPDAKFWTSEFGGENPLKYAKDKALQDVIRSKIEFLLASEREIFEYKDYNSLIKCMAAENQKRKTMQSDGEPVYGLSEYTPFTYYHYIRNNIKSELKYSQRDLVKPTNKQLKTEYEKNRALFCKGTEYEFNAEYSDGTKDKIIQSSLTVPKEDDITNMLLHQFENMNTGDVIKNVYYRGKKADITLIEKKHQGYQTIDEAKETLYAICADKELSELIESRANSAEIEFDIARYEAIEMP